MMDVCHKWYHKFLWPTNCGLEQAMRQSGRFMSRWLHMTVKLEFGANHEAEFNGGVSVRQGDSLKFVEGGSWYGWGSGKRRMTLFLTLNRRPQESATECKVSITRWIGHATEVVEDCLWWVIGAYIFKSSTNILNLQASLDAIPLIKIRNSMGPKMEPCGTPLRTLLGWLTWPLTRTLIVLSLNNSLIHWRMAPWVPRHRSLAISKLLLITC